MVCDGVLQNEGGLCFDHEVIQPYVEYLVVHGSAVMGFSQPLVRKLNSLAVGSDDVALSNLPLDF